MATLTMRFDKLKEVSAKLEPAKLYYPQGKAMLQDIGRIGIQALRQAAPVGPGPKGGRLKSRLSFMVNSSPKPMWVTFRDDAKAEAPQGLGSRGGKAKYPFAYPRQVEYSPSSPHHRWFKKALQSSRPKMRSALDKMAQAVEASWSQT